MLVLLESLFGGFACHSHTQNPKPCVHTTSLRQLLPPLSAELTPVPCPHHLVYTWDVCPVRTGCVSFPQAHRLKTY